MSELIRCTLEDDGVLVITINRPHARNAVNRAVSYGVCAAVDEMDRRDDLRVFVAQQFGHRPRVHPLQAFNAGDIAALQDPVDQ